MGRLLKLSEGERTQVRLPIEKTDTFDQGNFNKRQTLHHRKPRSIGGKNIPSNKIFLCRVRHDLWHRIFANLWPDEIVKKINGGCLLNRNFIVGSRLIGQCTELSHEDRIPSCYSREEGMRYVGLGQLRAWNLLFGGLSIDEIIWSINNEFLDPDYELYSIRNS